jgi:hypothetical protein
VNAAEIHERLGPPRTPATAWWCPECGLGSLRAPDNLEGRPAACSRCLRPMGRAVVFPERRHPGGTPWRGAERRSADLPL